MRAGDISNKQAPVISFHKDCFIVKDEREPSFLVSLFLRKNRKQEVNESNIQFANNLWRRTDYSFYLFEITEGVKYHLYRGRDLESILNFTELHLADDLQDLRKQVDKHNSLYYVDVDWGRISVVGSSKVKAVHFDTFKTLV